MNLRALAESDLNATLADTAQGGAVQFTLVDAQNVEHVLTGFVGDIGYLLDSDGLPIAGRSVVACYRLSSLTDEAGAYLSVNRAWKLRYSDMAGHEWTLSVSRFEPDRTIGIGRLILTLDLEVQNGV